MTLEVVIQIPFTKHTVLEEIILTFKLEKRISGTFLAEFLIAFNNVVTHFFSFFFFMFRLVIKKKSK